MANHEASPPPALALTPEEAGAADFRAAWAKILQGENTPLEQISVQVNPGANQESARESQAEPPKLETADRQAEKAAFIDKYFKPTETCPSLGQPISMEDARLLTADYFDRVAPDKRPEDPVAVLLEIEDMISEDIEYAQKANDQKILGEATRRLNAVSDLEAIATIPQYIEGAKNLKIFGTRADLAEYITKTINAEGNHGTKEMIESDPPVNGGALKVERTLGIIEELADDGNIEDAWERITQDGREGAIDWPAVRRFSTRGDELFSYDSYRRELSERTKNYERYKSRAEKLREIAANKDVLRKLKEGNLSFKDIGDKSALDRIVAQRFRIITGNRELCKKLRGGKEEGKLDMKLLTNEDRAWIDSQTDVELAKREYEEKIRGLIQAAAEAGAINDDNEQFNSPDFLRQKATKADEASIMPLDKLEAVKGMAQLGRDGFKEKVLLAGAPSIEPTDDVVDFLYANFKYNINACSAGSLKKTPSDYQFGFETMRRETERQVESLEAYNQENKDEAAGNSARIDLLRRAMAYLESARNAVPGELEAEEVIEEEDAASEESAERTAL